MPKTRSESCQPRNYMPAPLHFEASPRVWSHEENIRLTNCVKSFGSRWPSPISWESVVRHLPGRTVKQCIKHWYSNQAFIDPSISHEIWTEEEDHRLISLMQARKRGITFTEISLQMGTRTAHQCHGRWNSFLNPNDSHWMHSENLAYVKAHTIFGLVRNSSMGDFSCGSIWASIARYVPNKTGPQCRARWPYLYPGLASPEVDIVPEILECSAIFEDLSSQKSASTGSKCSISAVAH